MKLATVIYLMSFLIMAGSSQAQGVEVGLNEKSAASGSGRYEIVGSNLAAMWIFKIDKIQGEVFQLVRGKNGDVTWQSMQVLPHPRNKGGSHYQLFLSGLAAKWSFLINSDNGATWVLIKARSKKGEEATALWEPML